ncbi:MAG: SsrA-binding protein SmpB [Geminicoccaceae bacterium]|nr:SsrA-binding protein SmpB [Geminicoccaceae bacterium]MCS7266875.1 SsrA-binding protein SmpB [Geminicoccaceae bacterium]MCX7628861.1 SsrA-binding protein SmpB [Geminicoccaceae bacterium]MDW8124202.1 SsrA-binding protein SmpB [Geminicoccaceae bacterium]MDW8340575.1 SsrA-binding protein SmpB [Geminicoccaceae bacterium]
MSHEPRPGADREGERRVVAVNRKAFHDYTIEERIEAGIQLTGSEVKSLREGRAQITEAYAAEMGGELWLFNAYIPEYGAANRFNHEVRRPRRLLLHRRQIERLKGALQRKGMTLVPLSLYFSPRGWAKVELGLARGKTLYDKRAALRERDWQRERERLLRAGRAAT